MAGLSAGVDLFARYALAPNALGFCGPPAGLGASGAEVRAAATRFSGAWPYLQVLARLTGTTDPLDERLVESYWLGRDIGVDGAAFGKELLEIIGPQAGHYWSHLTPELLAQASGDHGFHVFGVYPWSRLLGAGGVDAGSAAAPLGDHPRHVLDSCRIRWGTVTGVGDGVEVETRRLTWDGTVLGLGEPAPERIEPGRALIDAAVGDTVSLHWEWLCDRLTTAQAADLEASTMRQLTAANARLRP